MTPQKRQKVFYVILAVAIVFGLIMKPWESPRPSDADEIQRQAQPVSVASTVMTSSTALDSETLSANIEYAVAWPKNPFAEEKIVSMANRPATFVRPASKAALHFQGVITIGDKQACVVNNQTYRRGWIIDGWSIMNIESEEILLVKDSDSLVLTLATQDWE